MQSYAKPPPPTNLITNHSLTTHHSPHHKPPSAIICIPRKETRKSAFFSLELPQLFVTVIKLLHYNSGRPDGRRPQKIRKCFIAAAQKEEIQQGENEAFGSQIS
jgi:hypothetical protein